jgi:hypothetical protein
MPATTSVGLVYWPAGGSRGLAGGQDRRDLAGDVTAGGDPGEGDHVDDPVLRPPADRVGEPGLAQAARADDRGDPGGAQQVRHRGDVAVAADQWVGLVGHAVPDHRGAALEQLLLHGLEGGAGVGAELVAQRAAVGLVPGQGGRGAKRRRLAAQQLHQHLLVPRALAGQVGERGRGLARAAQPGQGQRAGPDQGPPGRRPLGAQCRHRVVQPGAGAVRGAVPQGQARLGRGQRGRVVAGAGEPGARRRPQQHGRGVDLLVGQREAVAGGRAGDDVGAQLRPGPGDDHLEGLGRVLGQLLRPEPLDQPGGAAAPAEVAGEQREQATRPGTGDLLTAVRHPGQQGQLDGHPTRVAGSGELAT